MNGCASMNARRFFSGNIGVVFLGSTLLFSYADCAVAARAEPPKGWRYPTEADYVGNWKEFRKETPEPFHVRADFNGDSVVDDVWILLRTTGKGSGLFVFLSEPSGSVKLLKLEDDPKDEYPQRMGLAVVRPGLYQTACGRGHSECDRDEPKMLELNYPGINFFMYESANSFFYWDKKSSSFKRVWMSD